MRPGDALPTWTEGHLFVATLEDWVACPSFWLPEMTGEDCMYLTLVDSDDDASTNGISTGSWWLMSGLGPALFEVDAYGLRWSVTGAEWDD